MVKCIKNENDSQAVVRQVTWLGAGVNIILSALKIAVGFLAMSQSLIADGFHSLSDLITDGAVIIGSRFWGVEQDEKHPYGHQKLETIVSLLIALLLFAVACGIAWEAVATMQERQSSPPGMLAFYVAIISILTKELLYRWTVKIGKRVGSMALLSNAWHHRSDALSSIPVAVAVIGSYLFPSMTYLDHIAAIIVSVMLLKASFSIAAPCISQIMDVQGDRHLAEILKEMENSEELIDEFHKIRSRMAGSSIFVDLHMLVNPDMSVADSHALTKTVEKILKDHNANIVDVTIHVEPSENR